MTYLSYSHIRFISGLFFILIFFFFLTVIISGEKTQLNDSITNISKNNIIERIFTNILDFYSQLSGKIANMFPVRNQIKSHLITNLLLNVSNADIVDNPFLYLKSEEGLMNISNKTLISNMSEIFQFYQHIISKKFHDKIEPYEIISSIKPVNQTQIKCISDFPYHTDKKIIEYGPDAPSAKWVKNNIVSIEEKPFDGLVFWPGDYSVSLFLPWNWSEYSDHLDIPNLTTTNWNKYSGNNFLLLHTWTLNNWTDYWDDNYWSQIEINMVNLAKAARDSGCAGILLDTEWYSTKSPWSHDDMGLGHTLSETQAKIRQRGAQIMNAWQREYPDITILTTYLVKPIDWGSNEWNLLPYWVNGMLDVIGPDARLVHSDEDAYNYCDTTTWFNRYDELKVSKSGLTYLDLSNEKKWNDNVEIGKTLYWDKIMTINPNQTMKDQWEHNAYMGLLTSDQWTFVYSDTLNWWNVPIEEQPTGCNLTISKIDPSTSEGLLRAKEKFFANQPNGWDWCCNNSDNSTSKDTSVFVIINNTNPVTAIASSSKGIVTHVDFFLNMVLINRDNHFPYVLNSSFVPQGTYTAIAHAFDSNGKHGTSQPVKITIQEKENEFT